MKLSVKHPGEVDTVNDWSWSANQTGGPNRSGKFKEAHAVRKLTLKKLNKCFCLFVLFPFLI